MLPYQVLSLARLCLANFIGQRIALLSVSFLAQFIDLSYLQMTCSKTNSLRHLSWGIGVFIHHGTSCVHLVWLVISHLPIILGMSCSRSTLSFLMSVCILPYIFLIWLVKMYPDTSWCWEKMAVPPGIWPEAPVSAGKIFVDQAVVHT